MTRFTGTNPTISFNGVELDGARIFDPQDEAPVVLSQDMSKTVTVAGDCDMVAFDWFNRWLRLARVLLSHFSRN